MNINEKSVKSILFALHDLNTPFEGLLTATFLSIGKYQSNNKFLNNFAKKISEKNIEDCKAIFKKNNKTLTLDLIQRLFELSVDEDFRKLNGAFYTPAEISDFISTTSIEINGADTAKLKILDPSCGSGAFLLSAAKLIHNKTSKKVIEIVEENIFGIDIDPKAVDHAKILLSLYALTKGEDSREIRFNIINENSLELDNMKWFEKSCPESIFDIVIGNPPYVRIQNLGEENRKFIQKKWEFTSAGNTDLYYAFFELGLKVLKQDGVLGYITANSFLRSKTGKNFRKYVKKYRLINKIIDFDHQQVFSDATTYTAITFMTKKSNNKLSYALINDLSAIQNLEKLHYFEIDYSALDNDNWRLISENEMKSIHKIERNGQKLGDLHRINVGIATLADKVYLIPNATLKNGMYQKVFDEKEYLIEADITVEIIKANKLKKKNDLNLNNERIIFPYKKIGKKYLPIDEREMKTRFPSAYSYLQDNKIILLNRDKGKKKIVPWYAYGRNQSISTGFGEKILTPMMAKEPTFIHCQKEDALYYGGYAIFCDNPKFLVKILNSGIMEYYIQKVSKTYQGGFFSFAKSFIKNFSVPILSDEEIKYVTKENNKTKLDKFLAEKYGLTTMAASYNNLQH